MKKYLVAVLLVLFCANGAIAYQNKGMGNSSSGPRMNINRNMRNVTAEMKPKVAEVNKLREELRVELAKSSPNKTKARDIHNKIRKIQSELSDARFEEILKNPAEFMTGRSRKSNISVAEKTKIDQLKKLREEMVVEFKKENPDKAKLRTLQKKSNLLKTEFADIRFENRLKNGPKGDLKNNKRRQKNRSNCNEF